MVLAALGIGLLVILAFGTLVAYLTFWLLIIVGGGVLFMCALVVRGFMEGSDSGDYRVMVAGLIGLAIVGLVVWVIADHQRKEEVRKAEEETERLKRGSIERWLRRLI